MKELKNKINITKIKEKYNLELDKIIKKIKKQKPKNVLLQFPDGLKPYAMAITDYLNENLKNEKFKTEFLIWFGSCFGACDTPVGLESIKPKIDLLIQFGHSELMPEYI